MCPCLSSLVASFKYCSLFLITLRIFLCVGPLRLILRPVFGFINCLDCLGTAFCSFFISFLNVFNCFTPRLLVSKIFARIFEPSSSNLSISNSCLICVIYSL
eukprot:Lithocolla_globosa_v1_NODE_224_length_5048_cov_4.479976.p6 type:complete len:102 gc:universal NODE_224_length_5048_cov_4.479976:2405-2100(-)